MNTSADQLSNAPTVNLQGDAPSTQQHSPPLLPSPSSPANSPSRRKRKSFRFSFSDYPGPVFFKELSILSRRSSTYWTRGLFCLGLTFIICVTFIGIYLEWTSNTSAAFRLQSLQVVSPAIMMALSVFMAILLPLSAAALSGGAICDERRKGSLLTLMTTPITTLQIIIGKVAGASAQLLVLALLALPLLFAIRIFGGLPPGVVLSAFCIIATSTLMVASITTWLSIYTNRSSAAMVGGLTVSASIYFLPILLYFMILGMLMRMSPNPLVLIYSSPVALGITLNSMFQSSSTGVVLVDEYSWLVASLVNIFITCFSIAAASISLRRAIRKELDGQAPILQPVQPSPAALAVSPADSTPASLTVLDALTANPELSAHLGPAESASPSSPSQPNDPSAAQGPTIKPATSTPSRSSHSGLIFWIGACIVLSVAYIAQIVVHNPSFSFILLPASLIICAGTYFIVRYLSRTDSTTKVFSNPVLWREWRQSTFKSQRISLAVFAALTSLVFFVAIFEQIESEATAIITTLLSIAMMLVAAVTTTGALSSERESRTIESLLTTPLTAQEIVIGKLLGTLRRQWFNPVLLTFLILTVGVLTATISIFAIPTLALVLFPPLVFLNTTGVLLSILLPKSAQAAVLNIFVALFLWIGLPILAELTHELVNNYTDIMMRAGELLLYLNPIYTSPNIVISFAEDSFTRTTYYVPHFGRLDQLGILVFHLVIGSMYILASFVIMKLASRILAKRTLRKA